MKRLAAAFGRQVSDATDDLSLNPLLSRLPYLYFATRPDFRSRRRPLPAPPPSPRASRLSSPAAGGSGRVQCDGGTNERLERLFINFVALTDINGTPGAAFEAGVEAA
jgi:hypothetical protein